ncbi:MAG: TerB family tellurite resistance protein, partial [Planctomycetales bacterium]|nr:TerB family tellurite resistance protein [Planctomycetales bacterium]
DNAREELALQTGIKDLPLLDELSELGFTARTIVAIRLIPLVLVAWADHHVDARERQAILLSAGRLGVRRDTDAYVMLEHWLREMPPRQSADAWKQYMRRIVSKMGVKTRQRFVEYFKSQMMAVAKASGGHFGIGKVSAKERQIIEGFLEALRV